MWSFTIYIEKGDYLKYEFIKFCLFFRGILIFSCYMFILFAIFSRPYVYFLHYIYFFLNISYTITQWLHLDPYLCDEKWLEVIFN